MDLKTLQEALIESCTRNIRKMPFQGKSQEDIYAILSGARGDQALADFRASIERAEADAVKICDAINALKTVSVVTQFDPVVMKEREPDRDIDEIMKDHVESEMPGLSDDHKMIVIRALQGGKVRSING